MSARDPDRLSLKGLLESVATAADGQPPVMWCSVCRQIDYQGQHRCLPLFGGEEA